jgi:hypothetical protein
MTGLRAADHPQDVPAHLRRDLFQLIVVVHILVLVFGESDKYTNNSALDELFRFAGTQENVYF